MDIASQFRSLVIGKSVPGISACDKLFSFQTVFFKNESSYCYCRCAYDHEYFTYILATGDIDMEKFDILLKAVANGYCEHAINSENRDYLKETKVHTIHVAVALGSEDMVKSIVTALGEKRFISRCIDHKRINKPGACGHGGLFNLTPCDIGCLKHKENVLHPHLVRKIDYYKKILYARESEDTVFHIDEISLWQLCFVDNFVNEDSRTVLNDLDVTSIMYYELLFKLGSYGELKEIIQSLNYQYPDFVDDPIYDYVPDSLDFDNYHSASRVVTAIGELAVIYNQYDIFAESVNVCSLSDSSFNDLSQITQNIYTHPWSWEVRNTLSQACVAFQRRKFEDCVTKRASPNTSASGMGLSVTSNLEYLLSLLINYKLSRDHVKMVMEQIPDLQNSINERHGYGLTLLQAYICETESVEVSLIRTLIDLGANIDIPFSSGQSLLAYIISRKQYTKCFREVLELLLYENIATTENDSILQTAIQHDRDLTGPLNILMGARTIEAYNCRDLTGPQRILMGARTIEAYNYRDLTGPLNILMGSTTIEAYNSTSSRDGVQQNDQTIVPGTYIMDTIIHDDVFASDCTITILIEAGFRYTSSDIKDALELLEDSSSTDNSVSPSVGRKELRALSSQDQSTHRSQVKTYLKRSLAEPRPLMLRCRDVLRSHFPRRQIHRYVAVMDMPTPIRDFLLLKPILQRLPMDIKTK